MNVSHEFVDNCGWVSAVSRRCDVFCMNVTHEFVECGRSSFFVGFKLIRVVCKTSYDFLSLCPCRCRTACGTITSMSGNRSDNVDAIV